MNDTPSTPPATVEERVQFRTKDLNQAAFLWCQPGAELVRLQGSGEGRGTTIFFILTLPITEAELTQLVYDYANGKCSVEPRAFVAQQDNLRDLLHGSLAQNERKRKKTSKT